MVRVWRWLYSSHNTLHLRSCKQSVLQLLLAASSAQQDKATVILHSPHPSSIISTLVTLFSSYSPSPHTSLRSPLLSASHILLHLLHFIHDGTHYRSIHVAILEHIEDFLSHVHEKMCIKFYMLIYLIREVIKKNKRYFTNYNLY